MKKTRFFLSENFHFFVVKFSSISNRHAFAILSQIKTVEGENKKVLCNEALFRSS